MGKVRNWLPGRGAKTTLVAGLLGFVVLMVSQREYCVAAFPGANAKIAYSLGDTSSNAIWSVNADGSSPIRLTSGNQDYLPSYSADGGAIAFERGSDVYVMSTDGSGVRRVLAGKTSSVSETKWQSNYETPTGKIVPFVKVTTVTAASHYFKDPSFSPDGSWLVFVEGVEETISTNVCAVGEEKDQECLGEDDPGAYFDFQSKCKCQSQIIEAKTEDGGSTKTITSAESETEVKSPTFSAGGALAYVRSSPATPGSAIFVIRHPGDTPRQITSGPEDYAPDFAPNGFRIVFSHGESDVGLVGAAGGLLTILPVANPARSDGSRVESPVFSPDESRIAFGRSVFRDGAETEHGIYTIGVDGSSMVRIVDGGSAPSWQSSPRPVPLPSVKWAKVKSKKKKAKLDGEHRAVVGRIVCGSSRCKLGVISSKLEVGRIACSVRAILAKKLAPGKSTRVKVRVAGKCLVAIEKGQVGSLLMNVKVIGAPRKQMLLLEARLWAGKGAAKKRRLKHA